MVSVAVIAVPSFVIAIALLLTFSIWLDWLPVLGGGSGGLAALVAPVVSLSVGWIGYIARLMRTSMLEVMGEGFIRTAWPMGCRAGSSCSNTR